MKGISKFHVILLLVFGALAVSGVLIFALAVGSGSGNTTGAVTIWGTLDQAAFTTVIRQAAESNSQLGQVTYEQKDPTTYEQDLTSALASGQGPDIFILRSDYAMKDLSKVYQIPYSALSDTQFKTVFVQASEAFLAQNGIAAIPVVTDPLVLFWNRDLMGNAGYSRPPQYWDEVVPMATYVTGGDSNVNGSAITRRDPSNIIKKSAVAFGEYRNIPNAKDILATLILQAGGAITAKDNTGHIAPALSPRTAEGTQSSESALKFYTEFSDPSKNLYSWSRALPDARAAFAAGDLGIYVGHASEEVLINRMNPNLNFAVALLPQIRDNDHAIDTAYTYGFAISKQSRNAAGAYIVANLLSATAPSYALSIALGIPSARRDVLAGTAEGDAVVLNKEALAARYWIDPDPEKTNDIFQGMIESTVSGATRISDAVQRADQELAHILGL